MKVTYVGPYLAEGDLIDHGIHVKRGASFDVSDALGAELTNHPHFKAHHAPEPEHHPPPPPAEHQAEHHAEPPAETHDDASK